MAPLRGFHGPPWVQETLASAALDSDMVMEDNRRAALEAQAKLEELFRAADDDGDGHLSPQEFLVDAK